MKRTNVKNTTLIDSILFKSQKGLGCRLIDTVNIRIIVETIQSKLDNVLLRRDQKGVIFQCDLHAQIFASSYNGVPKSTHIVLKKGSKDWFLVGCYRRRCGGPTSRIVWENVKEYVGKIDHSKIGNFS